MVPHHTTMEIATCERSIAFLATRALVPVLLLVLLFDVPLALVEYYEPHGLGYFALFIVWYLPPVLLGSAVGAGLGVVFAIRLLRRGGRAVGWGLLALAVHLSSILWTIYLILSIKLY